MRNKNEILKEIKACDDQIAYLNNAMNNGNYSEADKQLELRKIARLEGRKNGLWWVLKKEE